MKSDIMVALAIIWIGLIVHISPSLDNQVTKPGHRDSENAESVTTKVSTLMDRRRALLAALDDGINTRGWPDKIIELVLTPDEFDQYNAEFGKVNDEATKAAEVIVKFMATVHSGINILHATHGGEIFRRVLLQSIFLDPGPNAQAKALLGLLTAIYTKNVEQIIAQIRKIQTIVSSKLYERIVHYCGSILTSSYFNFNSPDKLTSSIWKQDELSALTMEWKTEVFTDDIPFRRVGFVKNRVAKALKDYSQDTKGKSISDVPANFLMDLAYHLRSSSSTKEQAVPVVAAIIHLSETPSVSMANYYTSMLPKGDFKAPRVAYEDFEISEEDGQNLIESASKKIGTVLETQKKLFFEDPSEIKKDLSTWQNVPRKQHQELRRIAAEAAKVNQQEKAGTTSHSPKYWVNNYFQCIMNSPQLACWSYLCAASQVESNLKDLVSAHCVQHLQGNKGKIIGLPGAPKERRYLYTIITLLVARVEDTKEFTINLVKELVAKQKNPRP